MIQMFFDASYNEQFTTKSKRRKIAAGILLATVGGASFAGGIYGTHKFIESKDTTASATPDAAPSPIIPKPAESSGNTAGYADEPESEPSDAEERNQDVETNKNTIGAFFTVPIESKWASGSSDLQNNKDFGKWIGKKVTSATTWTDVKDCQTKACSLDEYAFFDGIIDISPGGINEGQTWAEAAEGKYDANFEERLKAIADKRRGKEGDTLIRLAHEFNGGYDWKTMAGEEEDFKKTFCRVNDIADKYGLKTVWGPNDTNFGGATVDVVKAWPGKECADVIGIDSYDWGHSLDEGTLEKPVGLRKWAEFAKQEGVPFAVPEWGTINKDPSKDNPEYIDKMHKFFTSIAPKDPQNPGPGELAYENYFNISKEGSYMTKIYPEQESSVPGSAKHYRELWSQN